ncbi:MULTISPECIES: calcium-binding protein [Pseudomonas]|uniref:calcium-binding protein n=1 Tax=Pseudomonas TaxID=286 RepID=UPI001A91940C|nr:MULTISPECIES: calcium-binding protein [Pseudomonas]MDF9758191.1 Ca2+-binding RTX toxin-like protein [Pseudomonas hunanensis]
MRIPTEEGNHPMGKPNDMQPTPTITLRGGCGDDVLDGGNGNDVIAGGKGRDVLEGGKGDDCLIGGKGDDVLDGGMGADRLYGGRGHDVLIGDSGRDVLRGGKGNDFLEGGLGTDILGGGQGADVFVFSKLADMGVGKRRDIVTDFNGAAGDRIDLRGLAKSEGLDSLVFVGDAAFTDTGQLRFEREILSGNVRGTLKPDFEIKLAGVTTFKAEYLML